MPGTVEIDRHGHLVNTSITNDLKFFNKKSLSEDDLKVTRDYLELVKRNNYSKKHQPINSSLPSNLNTPIIFLAGIDENAVASNSIHSSRRKVFSPHYKNENELLMALIEICKKNNFTLLYKQHPNVQLVSPAAHGDGYLLVNDFNSLDLIDQSDLLITIGSTLHVHSLMRLKPVLIAGNSPLIKYDLVSHLRSKQDLELTLKACLGSVVNYDGLIEYMSRLIKYYSFSYSSYSKSICNCNKKNFRNLCLN